MGNICHPRSYCIMNGKSISEFLFDYRATLAIGLVLYLNENKTPSEWLSHENGTLDIKILDYATELSLNYINLNKKEIDNTMNDDDDEGMGRNKNINELRWEQLREVHAAVIKFGRSFKPVQTMEINENYIFRVNFVAQLILHTFPGRRYDGFRNVWLLKPANSRYLFNLLN